MPLSRPCIRPAIVSGTRPDRPGSLSGPERCVSLRCMRNLLLSCLLLTVLAPAAFGQMPGSETHPAFRCSAVSFRDTTQVPLIEISIEIPPYDLSFVREGEGYRAEMDIAVTLINEDGDEVGGDIWRRQVDLVRYEELGSTGPVLREKRSFRVGRGRFQARVEVKDLNAGRSSVQLVPVEVEARKDPHDISLSDLEFGSLADSTGPAKRGSIHPVVARVFGNPLPRLGVYGEAYVDSAATDSVELRIEVRDEAGNSLEQAHMSLLSVKGVAPFLLRPAFERLAVGSYTLAVEGRWGKKKTRREQRFEMDESRVDFGPRFPDLLEVVALIASGDDLDSLRDCAPADRQATWTRFWQRRAGREGERFKPNAREFFQRLRYVSQHFSTPAVGPGWRTDMGRVYMKYGAPDQTEYHPQSANEFASQVWYYNDPGRIVFVFIDRSGFGHYELASQRGGG